jgi:hypothetical protein
MSASHCFLVRSRLDKFNRRKSEAAEIGADIKMSKLFLKSLDGFIRELIRRLLIQYVPTDGHVYTSIYITSTGYNI